MTSKEHTFNREAIDLDLKDLSSNRDIIYLALWITDPRSDSGFVILISWNYLLLGSPKTYILLDPQEFKMQNNCQ